MRKKNSQFIKLLKEGLEKIGTQSESAKLFGVSGSRIPEWLKGDRLPSPDTLIRIGKVALERGLPDPFFFWALAGVDTQTLRLMADKLQKRQYKLAGEIVPVSRFRYTEKGREEAGPPVPFPAEFVPNPATTICVIADEKSTALVDCPRGAILLDTSCEGAENLQALWSHVVLIDCTPGKHLMTMSTRAGIYAGRLQLEGSQLPYPQDSARMDATLWSLIAEGWNRHEVGHYLEPKGMEGVPPDDVQTHIRRWAEVRSRAISAFRLYPGFRVIGEVKGRLSGRRSPEFPATFA